ncbi:hypothetical protein [Methanosarcina barkeri]|nr:hypothetical protein [Methanosarcina barkeri]
MSFPGGTENSNLHSIAAPEKAGNFNQNCRALVSTRTTMTYM